MEKRTAESKASSEKSHRLVRRLGSPDAEERRVAQEEFLRTAAEDPALFHADLAHVIRGITGDRKRTSIRIGIGLGIAYVIYILFFALFGIFSTITPGSDMMAAVLWAAAVLTPLGLIGSGILRTNIVRRRRRLVECITEIDELNALPALIELLEFSNSKVQKAIMPPLTRLLARLNASDAPLLGFVHRTALARTLTIPATRKLPASFFVAALQAFEHIGDSQVLPTVTWLAQGKGAGGDHLPIQEAAQTCQTYLQEQLRRHQAHSHLLRPSGPTEAPQTLLRPVVNAPDAAPQELLRPDDSVAYAQSVLSAFSPPESTPELVINKREGPETL